MYFDKSAVKNNIFSQPIFFEKPPAITQKYYARKNKMPINTIIPIILKKNCYFCLFLKNIVEKKYNV